ncbi:hypothetical protein MNBD_GAMMA01-289 [hydrothermal vent metagenome]|uniref:Uncharacterized protein n=1 Tax=hydrothermal vent metagenome TaxID=652676 RepID=A0A3B0V7Y3_9ZZZZ
MIDENNKRKNLQQVLINAIARAEKAAMAAEKAAKKAKKAAKKVKKAQLKIKASKKRIIALQKSSDEKSESLRDEIIEIASKAAKKNKALKKIAKMNPTNEE